MTTPDGGSLENQDGVDVDGFWLRLARDADSSASSFFDANVRTRVINDIRQFQSEHAEGSKYFTDAYRLKSKLFRPKTRAAIRKNEAVAAGAYFSTEDVMTVRATDDDDPLQLAAADLLHELMQLRLTRPHPDGMPWFLTCMGAYQEAQSVGIVASFQSWKYNEQKKIDRPDSTLMPIENVRFDPAADWRDVVNGSPYLIIYWPMYLKDVKAKMKRRDDEAVDGGETPWRPYRDTEILAASKSSDTIRLAREQQGTDSTQANTADSNYSVVWVHQNFIEVDGVDVMFYTLGTERLLSDPVPVEDVYPQGRPVVIGFAVVEAHKGYKSSLSSLTRDTQAEINDVANLRIDNVKLRLHKRYFAARGKNIDLRSLTRNSPSSVTLMDNPTSDVKVVTTDDATSSSYQEQDRLNLDFDDLAGVFSGSSVQSNRQLNETVGGMEMLSANATQVSEYQLRTFTETWVEPVLRQVLTLEQAHESDARILTAAAKAAGIDPMQVTEAMLVQQVMLSVNVGVGAVNPQMQLQRFVGAMKLVSEMLGGDFLRRPLSEPERAIVKEVFGKSGYKDGSRFLMPESEEEDPQVAQLKEMIQQLQQRLALKEDPALTQAKVAKLQSETELNETKKILQQVEATNRRVEALYSAMSTAQTAVSVPGVTPVADAIAKSAGFQDLDDGEIFPADERGGVPVAPRPIPKNTDPRFPANPERGMMSGIETGGRSLLGGNVQ